MMSHLMENKGCVELMGYLHNNNIHIPQSYFQAADDNDAHAYLGYHHGERTHTYLVAAKADDGEYLAQPIRVWLGPEGRMVAEFIPDYGQYYRGDLEAVRVYIRQQRWTE
jgi:hypothetical protein